MTTHLSQCNQFVLIVRQNNYSIALKEPTMVKYAKTISWLLRLGTVAEFESKHLLNQGKKASISGASGLVRQASTTTAKPATAAAISSSLPENLRKNYEKFQRDDGVPVYLKGGLPDRLLLGLTVALIVIGLVDGLTTVFKMAVPKKAR